jgi:hypothetical protein
LLDTNVVSEWVRARPLGQPIGVIDAFLAATAEVHGLTLVTRNVADFPPSVRTF